MIHLIMTKLFSIFVPTVQIGLNKISVSFNDTMYNDLSSSFLWGKFYKSLSCPLHRYVMQNSFEFTQYYCVSILRIMDRKRANVNCNRIYRVARATQPHADCRERGCGRAIALSHPVRRLPGHPLHPPVTTHSLRNTTARCQPNILAYSQRSK